MEDNRLTYRRKLFNVRSWGEFTIGHVAFALHRVTGWLLLGWLVVHLFLPTIRTSPSAVYLPTAEWVIVLLLAVLVFHTFNGIRLVIIELGGLSPAKNQLSFRVTLGLSVLLIALLVVGL